MPDGHKCKRLHGHSYVVELVLEAGDVNGVGMVRDYAELDGFKEWLMANLDHRNLNDFMERMDGSQSTAENLARVLYGIADLLGLNPTAGPARLVAVRVKETDNTWAEFTP